MFVIIASIAVIFVVSHGYCCTRTTTSITVIVAASLIITACTRKLQFNFYSYDGYYCSVRAFIAAKAFGSYLFRL